jgi:hypothetical protein
MQPDSFESSMPAPEELQEICQTISGLPSPNDQIVTRLRYVADLLANAGALPNAPILVWREEDRSVRHALIGEGLVVGRQTDETGLSLPDDNLLSRRHFAVRTTGAERILEDLQSRNGTAINRPEERVQQRSLCDGDLILAGNHVFAFLDQSKTV